MLLPLLVTFSRGVQNPYRHFLVNALAQVDRLRHIHGKGRMNTPAHLIFGAAAFARPDAWKVTTAALFGALLPDLSLYVLCIWHLFILGMSPEVVFGKLYFSDGWVRIFRADNSFVLWGIA